MLLSTESVDAKVWETMPIISHGTSDQAPVYLIPYPLTSPSGEISYCKDLAKGEVNVVIPHKVDKEETPHGEEVEP